MTRPYPFFVETGATIVFPVGTDDRAVDAALGRQRFTSAPFWKPGDFDDSPSAVAWRRVRQWPGYMNRAMRKSVYRRVQMHVTAFQISYTPAATSALREKYER